MRKSIINYIRTAHNRTKCYRLAIENTCQIFESRMTMIFSKMQNILAANKKEDNFKIFCYMILNLVAMLVQVVMQTRSQKFSLPVCCKGEAAKDEKLLCILTDQNPNKQKHAAQNSTGA